MTKSMPIKKVLILSGFFLGNSAQPIIFEKSQEGGLIKKGLNYFGNKKQLQKRKLKKSVKIVLGGAGVAFGVWALFNGKFIKANFDKGFHCTVRDIIMEYYSNKFATKEGLANIVINNPEEVLAAVLNPADAVRRAGKAAKQYAQLTTKLTLNASRAEITLENTQPYGGKCAVYVFGVPAEKTGECFGYVVGWYKTPVE